MVMPEDERLAGWAGRALIVGVGWRFNPQVISAASGLAAGLGAHLVCAFVDPGGYLAELEPGNTRVAASIDPAPNPEALYPAAQVRAWVEAALGSPGELWSLRVLNGSVAEALARLAESTGASAIVVGGPRRGFGASISRVLERPVSHRLALIQGRPVIVVPATWAGRSR